MRGFLPSKMPVMLEGAPAFGVRWILPALLLLLSAARVRAAAAAEEQFHLRTLWEDHPVVMAGVIFAVLVQSVLITALLFSRRRGHMAEESLRLSEERYREVVESQSELVCRYHPDLTLMFVNEAYCRAFGKKREELLGVSLLTLIPEDKHAEIREIVRRLIEGKKPVSSEHEVLRPDGSIGWMQWDDYPIYDEKGQLEELQGIGRDVTERKQAEDKLRQSEERFAGVFKGSPIAIAIMRQADGCLMDVNPSWERAFGISRGQALGLSPVQLGLLGGPESALRFRAFLDSGRALNGFEQMISTRGGGLRWMNMSCELVHLGDVPCYVVMSRDITELKEAEEARQAMVHASRLAILGELTASIAHEINQPLGAILGNAETAEFLLRQSDPPLEELKQILADIRRDDLRASEVIKRVRALVGKRKVRMQAQSLNVALADVWRLIAQDAQRRGVTIASDFAEDLPVVSCDRAQIEQVVLNLLLNAMDAVADLPAAQRNIMLRSVRLDAEWVEAGVEDSGQGIAPEKLDRIFDSFFTTKPNGMGLGLALSRSIAESHGGRLTAENLPAGGAAFRLSLPIKHPAPEAHESA